MGEGPLDLLAGGGAEIGGFGHGGRLERDSLRLTHRKARALPWTRWGRRPQTPILSVPRLASAASKPAQSTVLREWYRGLPPRSANDSGGTPSGGQGPEPHGRRSQSTSTYHALIKNYRPFS